MRIMLITQDDPFFLPKSINYLAENLPHDVDLVAAIVLPVSPFGKRESFFRKALKTLNIFGIQFFLFYSLQYLFLKLFRPDVRSVLRAHDVKIENLHGSINSNTSLELISSYQPDLLISIASNQIFKSKLLNIATHGCINLHTGLLPNYRGLMPTFWAMRNGENEIGISVFEVDEGIDSGPIIVQTKLDIRCKSQFQVIQESKQMGVDNILEAIDLTKRNAVVFRQNLVSEGSYFGFPEKSDVKVFKKKGKRFF